jgi:hypothetical protein
MEQRNGNGRLNGDGDERLDGNGDEQLGYGWLGNGRHNGMVMDGLMAT